MAVLKQIKFGTGNATPIAQTVVTAASDSVLSVNGTNTKLTDKDNPSYEVDLRIDNATLVKSSNSDKVLKVGTVPAAQVTVDKTAAGITSTDAQAAFKELKDGINAVGGAAKSYKIVTTEPASNNTLVEYKIQEKVGSDGTWSDVNDSATIAVPKDQHLKNVELVNQRPADTEHSETDPVSGQFLKFTYVLTNGSESDIYVDVSAFLTEKEFGNGLQASSAGVVSVKIDSASEKFLTVGKDGVKLAGVQDAINNAVAGLNVTDAAKAGQYVSQVSETDGKIAVKRANVSDAVLNGYAKGEKPTSTAIAATDDVKGALAKLEHQVDAAKAAATTKVAEGTDTGNNMTITSATSDADGSTTYTINLTDVASKAALDAEIAARKAVDGQEGQTYVANGSTKYISGAISLNDADVKLDAALKAEETRAKSAETSIDAAIGLTKGENNETRTYANTGVFIGKETSNTVVSDIKALDTQLKKVTDDLAAVQYKVNGTTLEFYGMTEHA